MCQSFFVSVCPHVHCKCGQTDTKKVMRTCMENNITFTIKIPKYDNKWVEIIHHIGYLHWIYISTKKLVSKSSLKQNSYSETPCVP